MSAAPRGTPWTEFKHKAGPKHGLAIRHDGSSRCPVPSGTPISVWHRNAGYWVAITAPFSGRGREDWSDIVAYRIRYPEGRPVDPPHAPPGPTVALPRTKEEAHAMIAVAQDWLRRQE